MTVVLLLWFRQGSGRSTTPVTGIMECCCINTNSWKSGRGDRSACECQQGSSGKLHSLLLWLWRITLTFYAFTLIFVFGCLFWSLSLQNYFKKYSTTKRTPNSRKHPFACVSVIGMWKGLQLTWKQCHVDFWVNFQLEALKSNHLHEYVTWMFNVQLSWNLSKPEHKQSPANYPTWPNDDDSACRWELSCLVRSQRLVCSFSKISISIY